MSLLGKSIGVIIPAFNEERALPSVLAEVPGWVDRVVVVDNGSTDRTAAVARHTGAVVIAEQSRGYGSACLAGIAAQRDLDILVFLDGDHSDYPDRMVQLVEPIASDHADFVLSSRLAGERQTGAMPPQAIWGNRLACFLMRCLFGYQYTDLGPFRAIRGKSLNDLGMADRNFGWTVEMQIKASRAGLRIREVPVPYRQRIGVSKISGTISGTIKAGYKILYTIFKYGICQ